MRRSMLCLGLILAACTTGQEQSPSTTVLEPPPTSSSTTSSPTTSTTTQPTTTTTLAPLQSLAYEEAARIEFPIQMVPGTEGMSLVATKDGRVWLMGPDGEIRPTPVLDISGQVHNEGERGLLSIVGDEVGDHLYVHYSENHGDTVVSEFTWAEGSLVDERVLLGVHQPAGNHNGGMLQFGPDGGLYVGLGDGGGANDRYGNGQNTDTLLGGLVRIDVDDLDAEPELFQYGLRNPWRFWIDRAGDDLIYIADVGQDSYEEIDVAPLEAGINYGWPVYEGLHCFSSGCDGEGWTSPVLEVGHGDAGTCSITGGMVYRGQAIPEIQGLYFYSDYCGGYLRSFRLLESGVADEATDWTEQVGAPGSVVSFGVDYFGEMYVLTTDRILQVVPVRGE